MDSHSTSLQHGRSSPVSDSERSPPAKRRRQTSQEVPIDFGDATRTTETRAGEPGGPAPSVESMPSALRLVEAMKYAGRLQAIGYCPASIKQMSNHMLYQAPEGLTEEQVAIQHVEVSPTEREREKRNSAVIREIATIYSEHANNVASGYLDKPFRLQLHRAGCEYDGLVTPPKIRAYDKMPIYTLDEKEAISQQLQSWYHSADTSGYGDVREQVTKIDADVRKAREIPASEFEVESELIARIAELWDRHFYPNHGIRVEAYKIHLYGTGDHFREHRDTPQQDLVGTFLLGLGDTTYGGGLVVDGRELRSDKGQWCAFYPDVPHMVKKVHGYRAVVAFKIFHDPTANGKPSVSSGIRAEVSELLRRTEAPFGIMLERKYCLGTTQFSGFDALLYNSLLDLGDAEIRHLPVILDTYSEWGSHNTDDREEDYEMTCSAQVYPFTRGHIEVLGHFSNIANIGEHYKSYQGPTDHTSCGCPWLEGVTNVPFFSFDLARSLYVYSSKEEETCNFYGNEAQAWREDSVYLTYAVIVLPKVYQPPAADQ